MNGKNRQNDIARGFRKQNRLMRISMMMAFALLLTLMLAGTAFAAESSDDDDVLDEGSVYMESGVEDGLAEEPPETADSVSSAGDDENAELESAGSGDNDEESGKGGTASGKNEAEAGTDNDGDAAKTDETGTADEMDGSAGQNAQDDEGADEEANSDDSVETKVTKTAAKTGGLSNLGTPKTGDSFPLVCILIFAASLTLIGIVVCRALQRRGTVS